MTAKKDRAHIEAHAEKYVKRGKLKEAIEEYNKLLTGDEQDIPVRNILCDLCLKLSKKDAAIGELQKIAELYEKGGLYSKSIAIVKRMIRIDPEDLELIKKLAHLYAEQGVTSEAKTEYLKLAGALQKRNKNSEAIQIYEKLLQITPNDVDLRKTMAELYQREGHLKNAVGELNTAAEIEVQNNNLKQAYKILVKARELIKDDSRTLTNLLEIFKRENRNKEALSLVSDILKKDKNNVKALYLLGNQYYTDKNYKEASKVYLQIISIRSSEFDARIKLGRIYIQSKQLDHAYEIFNPVVDHLVRKQKIGKAIGLLGLIVATKTIHLLTLEKLAYLYRFIDQRENFEVVCQVLLDEYASSKLNEKKLAVLRELKSIFPENETYAAEHKKLQKELGIGSEEPEPVSEEKSIQDDESARIIASTFSKADLYMEQGLVRNAKRILENLRMRFPDDPAIEKKLSVVKKAISNTEVKEITSRVETAVKKETQVLEKPSLSSQNSKTKQGETKFPAIAPSGFPDDMFEEKVTSADVFAETDIIPLVPTGVFEKYFDLTHKVSDELEAIQAILNYQIRGDTTIVEKPLTEIVADFRRALDETVSKENYESHYNLGIAFVEQGLFDEAIEECRLASHGERFKIDSYSILSLCYRNKKDFKEALRWLNKAVELAKDGSYQLYALKYELSSLYEEMGENKKALEILKEVEKWDSSYRETEKRIGRLEKGN